MDGLNKYIHMVGCNGIVCLLSCYYYHHHYYCYYDNRMCLFGLLGCWLFGFQCFGLFVFWGFCVFGYLCVLVVCCLGYLGVSD